MIGSVARCKHNKLGVITDLGNSPDGRTVYYGIGFDGRSWESTSPTILAASLDSYLQSITAAPSLKTSKVHLLNRGRCRCHH